MRSSSAQISARGTINATLSAGREGITPVVRVNKTVLAVALDTMKALLAS